MAIISIQSQVITGHVGNSAAVPALQLRGHEVWAVPTVLLSHHPGHGGARGAAVAGEWFAELVEGMAFRGSFGSCEAVISGYLGSQAAAGLVEDVLRRVRPRAVYLCDPVIGDDGRRYVSPEIATCVHHLATLADILTPNAYELAQLSGHAPADRAEAVMAMRTVQMLGPKIVVVTSFQGRDTPPETLDVLAVDGAAAWRVSVPKIDRKFSGAGDLFAALFLSFYLADRDARAALGQSCALLQEVLIQTKNLATDELALVASRHQLISHRPLVLAEPLA
jgi:pyridoxine kinase